MTDLLCSLQTTGISSWHLSQIMETCRVRIASTHSKGQQHSLWNVPKMTYTEPKQGRDTYVPRLWLRKSEIQIHLSTLCSVQFCAVFVHILEIILCKQPQISASICIGPLILPEIKISLKSNQTWNYLNIQDFIFLILSRQCFNQTRQSIELQLKNSDQTTLSDDHSLSNENIWWWKRSSTLWCAHSLSTRSAGVTDNRQTQILLLLSELKTFNSGVNWKWHEKTSW